MAIPIGKYKQAVEALAQRMQGFYDKAILDIEKEWQRSYVPGSKFADEIEALAQETNQEINDKFIERFCHKAVMTLMLKFLFLRFAEDKKILKPYFKDEVIEKWQKENKEVTEIIRKAFEEAREKFRGLYKTTVYDEFLPSETTLKIYLIDALSDEPKSGLYKGKGSLDFATLDPRVVSAFYEKLFDRQKRKELGLFFTPPIIADYLVEKAFGGQKITKDFLVLDPACGSGQILLATYRRLKDAFVNDLKMTPDEAHKQILSQNLWGIDVEPFAVLLSKINLALQDLENVPEYINIIHGDSLLETGFDVPQMAMLKDVGENQKQKLIKETVKTQGGKEITFWRNGSGRILFEKPVEQAVLFELAERMKTGIFFEEAGIRTMKDLPQEFDAVVANPPYVSFRILLEDYKKRIKGKFVTLQGFSDIYISFVELGIKKLRDSGKLAFIMPNKFMASDYGEPLRSFILDNATVQEILDLSAENVFEDASNYPVIMILEKNKREENLMNIVENATLSQIERGSLLFKKIPQTWYEGLPQKIFATNINKNNFSVLKKIIKISTPLGIKLDIKCGIASSGFGKDINNKSTKGLRILRGRSIRRFSIKEKPIEYLHNVKKYATQQHIKKMQKEKLLFAGMSTKLTIALDKKGVIVGRIYYISNLNENISKYLLCLLNSSLLDWFYKFLFKSVVQAGGYLRINEPYIKQLPIYPATPEQQKPFIKMADTMLELNKKLQETEKSFYKFIEEKIENKIPLREIEELDFVNIKDSQAKLGEKGKIGAEQKDNTVMVAINKKPTIKIVCQDKISSEFLTKYLGGLQISVLSGKDGDSWIERILNTKIHWDRKPSLEKLLNQYKTIQASVEEIKKQIAEIDKKIDEMVYDLYGITEEERKIIEEEKL